MRSRLASAGRDLLQDAIAGQVAAVVLIANIVSFGALMFPGKLSSGMPTAIWAMLIGSSIGGVWSALKTSIPPIATAIDSPAGTVLVLLSASAGASVLAAGGSPATAVQAVMLIFTSATVLIRRVIAAARCLPLGLLFPFRSLSGDRRIFSCDRVVSCHRRLSHDDRPRVVVQRDRRRVDWTALEMARLAAAVCVLLVLLAVRRGCKSAFATPVALLSMWLTGAIVLQALGLSAPEQGWHFPLWANR